METVGRVFDVLQTLGGLALIVAVVTLIHTEWSRRVDKFEASAQGLYLNSARMNVVTCDDGPEQVEYHCLIRAKGPGTRYDVRTHLWNVPRESWGEVKKVHRFTNVDEPLKMQFTIPRSLEECAWFGIIHQATRGQEITTLGVRVNLKTGEIQVWHWYAFRKLRRAWERQQRGRVFGGGTRKQLGEWRSVRGDELEDWQTPAGSDYAESRLPRGARRLMWAALTVSVLAAATIVVTLLVAT